MRAPGSSGDLAAIMRSCGPRGRYSTTLQQLRAPAHIKSQHWTASVSLRSRCRGTHALATQTVSPLPASPAMCLNTLTRRTPVSARAKIPLSKKRARERHFHRPSYVCYCCESGHTGPHVEADEGPGCSQGASYAVSVRTRVAGSLCLCLCLCLSRSISRYLDLWLSPPLSVAIYLWLSPLVSLPLLAPRFNWQSTQTDHVGCIRNKRYYALPASRYFIYVLETSHPASSARSRGA